MKITLELSPQEAARLKAHAAMQGVDVNTVVRRILAQWNGTQTLPSPISEKNQAAIALLDAWRTEDAQMTDEERTEADRDVEEFKASINRWRAEEGRPPAFR